MAANRSNNRAAFDAFSAERAQEIIATHRGGEGPLLPILIDMQETFGCVPGEAVPIIAQALNLSRAEVHGVVSFYHDFTGEPQGRRLLKLCRAEACQAAGGDALVSRAEAALGISLGETTADGEVTLQAVYCLGLCATAPSAMFDGAPVGRLDERGMDVLLTQARK